MGKYAKTAFMIAGFAVSVAFGGNHWYVDAVNGDDRWDGKVAFSAVDQNANAGPKKTFANLFTDCQIQSDDVVHAYSQHIRHLRVPDQQQDKALRYHHPGKHQLRNVELRCRSFTCDAYHHRNNQSPSG